MRHLLPLVVAIFLLCGCDRPPEVHVPAPKPLRIICITPCVNEPFFQQVRRGAMDAAQRMNVQCEFVGTTGVDVAAQAQMLRQAVLDNYDGIAVNVIDANAFSDEISEALGQGIPVVAFNINSQSNPRLPAVVQDLYQAGQVAAESAAQMITEGSAVLVTGHEGTAAADDRYRGLFDGLRSKNLRYIWVNTSGNVREVEQTMLRAMREHPDAKTIIASGLSNTEGVGHAVEGSHKGKGYVVVGFDTSPEVQRLIDEHIVTFTVDQQAYIQGFYPVMQLALARQQGIVPTDMDAGARVIHANNREKLGVEKVQ